MKSGKIKWKQLLVCLALPLAVGALAGFLNRAGMKDYENVYKPLLSPPGWVFPLVWTALYLVMGWASYLVYTSQASPERIRRALMAYGVQLGLNFLWPCLFFSWGMYLAAFVELVALFGAAAVCAVRFYYLAARAGKLFVPYLLWLFFAAYLNLGVFLLN